MKYHYSVPGDDFSLAGNASSEIKKILQRLGIPVSVIKRTAVAMYEAEMNMAVHAGGGEADISIDGESITIVMKDHGPGISNIELAMQDGYSTAPQIVHDMGFGAGMGLPNMKRNSDEFKIESVPGEGTTVTMIIRITEAG
jgi:serine/threonine-protein kinase RsbT